jgi:hypothetical protein
MMDLYDKLFEEYISEMKEARKEAEAWWESVLAEETETTGTREAAEKSVRNRWPFGPASHPYVIAVYRKYYMACEVLNQKVKREREECENRGSVDQANEAAWGIESVPGEKKGSVPPSVFTLDWLFGKHDSLRVFLADLVFSPWGIDDLRR